MKEHISEQMKINGKINILYENIYGDADPSSVPISGISTTHVVAYDISNYLTQINTASSLIAIKCDVQTLFVFQSIITKDLE